MYQKGERRRDELLRATLRLIGERGSDAVTHRAVADEAGLALSATTYYFASKEELLEQTFLLAAREETERLEGLVLELAPLSLSAKEWAGAVAEQLSSDVREDPDKHLALVEFALQAARMPPLRAELLRWQEAHIRLAETGCRSIASPDPPLDARVVVAAITGLMLEQLASGREDFGDAVMRPTLERLFERLSARPAEALEGVAAE